jgi:F0F1-type ATP synthase assembly protein I
MARDSDDREGAKPEASMGSSKPKSIEPNPWALAGMGLELAAGVAVFSLLGWWLDKQFLTTPWLMVTGAGLGLAGSLYNVWKQVKRFL